MLTKNILAFGLGRGLSGAINFLTLPLLTHFLSSEEFGIYAILIATIGLTNAFGYQWIRHAAIRFYPSLEDDPRPFFATTNFAFVIATAFGTTLLLGSSLLAPGSQNSVLALTALYYMIAQALFELTREGARASLSPVQYGLASMVRSTTSVVLLLITLYLELGVSGVFMAHGSGALIAAILIPSKWYFPHPKFASMEIGRRLAAYGLPLSLTTGITFLIDSSDRYILGILADLSSVGLYAAAFSLAQQPLGVLLSTLHLAAFPVILRAESTDREPLVKTYATLILGVGVPSATFLSMYSSEISHLILGREFSTHSHIIPLISFSILFYLLKSYLLNLPFQLDTRTHKLLIPALSALALNLLFNFALVPVLGILGAALSAALTSVAYMFLTILESPRSFKIQVPWRSLGEICVGTLIASALSRTLLPPSSLVNLSLVALLYTLSYISLLLAIDVGGFRSMLVQFLPRRQNPPSNQAPR